MELGGRGGVIQKLCGDCAQAYVGGYRSVRCPGCRATLKRKRGASRPSRAGSDYYERVVKANPARYAEHQARGARNQERVSRWLQEYKLQHGCMDCGWAEHYAGLELDHTCGKTEEIVKARSSIERLQTEIQNGCCMVRCSRCHGIKSWAEKNRHASPTGMCREGDDCAILPRTQRNQARHPR